MSSLVLNLDQNFSTVLNVINIWDCFAFLLLSSDTLATVLRKVSTEEFYTNKKLTDKYMDTLVLGINSSSIKIHCPSAVSPSLRISDGSSPSGIHWILYNSLKQTVFIELLQQL